MEDQEAIRCCLKGDMNAFEHVVRRHQQKGLAHARALTGNDADAADALQDAFVDAFRALARFDLDEKFYPWFAAILRNRCIKQRTRRATRPESGVIVDRETRPPLSPEQSVGLSVALDRLGPDDRELIVLKHLHGWTYDELAAHLGTPRGTIMSRLFTARQKLQVLMSGDAL